MNRWAGKVAVVTGASAGIGLATVKDMVKDGMIVVGLARRKDIMEERMKGVAGPGKFYAKQCDIVNEQEVIRTFDWIKKTVGTVHILINNAGVLKENALDACTTEELHYVIDVNVWGLIYCSREALKLMKSNGEEGHIVNVNSTAGLKTPSVEGKYFGIYSASKFAARSLTESLNHELRGTKIRTSNISPGLVKTEIFEMGNIDTSFLSQAPALTSEDVSYFILQIVKAPQHVQILELTIKPTGEPVY